jgi:hypothetical protein
MSDTEDSEKGSLMDGGKSKKSPDWSRFGLSKEQQATTQRQYDSTTDAAADLGQHNELYREEQVSN